MATLLKFNKNERLSVQFVDEDKVKIYEDYFTGLNYLPNIAYNCHIIRFIIRQMDLSYHTYF